ncbi:uncharacterized protein LOC129237516 [Anastrepha obliqua]|uniref:uncharacterized protein LOC129237516 n=1 Tax=Anastrepha obliqua TaxID=95512 RepID=UPI002409CED1|nr:uncharacterized protein LOC129237516 [Anastrepha obliqua]
MSKLEKHKETIAITHFINPHLFWYHKIDACNVDYCTILEIEKELAEYYRNHQAWTQALRHPKKNAMVAVKFLAWNKIIRARVDHVAAFGKNVVGGEFVMWAVDYGFPFQTKADQIYRLPEKLTAHVNYIRSGGLVNILPADNFFMKDTMVKRITSKWDQRACHIVEQAINNSESIVFVKGYCLNGQEWGELVIKTNMGIKYRVNDHLVSLHLAVDARPNFREECLKLKTNKILPWMCNNGTSKFRTNRAYIFPAVGITHNGSKCATIECNDITQQKVEEWHERNKYTCGYETDDFLDTTTECTMTDGSVIESVPVRKCDQQGSDLTKIAEHEESQHMQLAGVLSKSRVEKYAGGKLPAPPLPDSVDFEMKTGNARADQTIDTTYSEISPIKYVNLEESTVNSDDVREPKLTDDNNATALACAESFHDYAKNGAENKVTAEKNKNLGQHDERSSLMPDGIGSFAEYLMTFRKQYIEKKINEEAKISKKGTVLPNKVVQSKSFNFELAALTKSNKSEIREPIDLKTTFHGLRMIPAGFDIMNLHDYKNEEHWHCKKSTINDRVPYNDTDLGDFVN